MPSDRHRPLQLFILAAVAALVLGLGSGCRRVIGDGCRQNIDCAFSNDRQCDLTQREGYCTVVDCTRGGCPDQASCVQFEAHTPRLARTFCMAHCAQDSHCRAGYHCEVPTVTGEASCPEPETSGDEPPACTRILEATPVRPGFCIQNVTTP